MSLSSDEEDISEIDPFTGKATHVTTQGKYKIAYKKFMNWKADKNYESCTENTVLEYFTEMSKKFQPSTLWCTYSMLKSMLKLKQGLDIGSCSKLLNFLKRRSVGYKTKKSKVLSLQEIERFLDDAPDSEYLAMKVALIFGINGSCSCNEICSFTINDVEEHGQILLVNIKNINKTKSRTFSINGKYCQIVKKYMNLRSKKGICNRFFQHYMQGKCRSQPIGKTKIGEMPKKIAKFLGLPNPNDYTCQMFKRFSKMIHRYGEPNLLSRLDRECHSNTQEKSYTEKYHEKFAERTESINIFSQPPELPNTSNETLALQKHKANSDSNQNNNKKSECNGSNDIDKCNSEIEFSNYEIALSRLPDSVQAVVKADPEQSLSPVSHSYEDPLSPLAFENELNEFDNINLCKTDKALNKNVFIFNNCTFNNCFNSINK